MVVGSTVIIGVGDRVRSFPLRGRRNLGRLRQYLLFGVGVALFVAGAITLSIGLVSYLDQNREESDADLFSYPQSLDEVEGLPVAIPYYNPPRTVAEPEPEPVAAPLRLIIESTGVDAPVIEMGLDEDGIPNVPLNGQDVAWYNFSSLPGTGSNAVFAGHINWERAPGVFADLDDVQTGDTVRLISEDGAEYTYEVFANFYVDPEDRESLKVMAPTDTDTVTLITCGGTWLPNPSEQFGGRYTNRTIVQAKLVDTSVAVPTAGATEEL